MGELEFSGHISCLLRESGYLARTEINSGYGIADVVAIRVDKNRSLLRLKHQQTESLPNENHFRVLALICDEGGSEATTLDELLGKLNICKSYTRVILENLCNLGFVKHAADGAYVKINGWGPLSDDVVAIESKLTNWRRGISQAWRYKKFADEVYLAMPPQSLHPVDRRELKSANVGLLTIVDGELRYVFKPSRQKKSIVESKRNYVCEYFWDVISRQCTHVRLEASMPIQHIQ